MIPPPDDGSDEAVYPEAYAFDGDETPGDDELYPDGEIYPPPEGSERSIRVGRSYPHAASSPGPAARPLRVIHASWSMMPAGIDRWLTGLIRYADPRRLKFLRCLVLGGHVDWKQLTRVGVPVEMGRRD